MNIGILTFHWGANHGAILQVYALSQHLQNKYNANVEIIDYYPKNLELTAVNALNAGRPSKVLRKFKELKKEKYLKPFRRNLNLTKRYYTNAELIAAKPHYDILICGSDQIWNPGFLQYGENKITPTYFLNFADEATKKISVSASFGCSEFPVECGKLVLPLLKEFSALSVRENTGLDILMSLGFTSAQVTADPTALLSSKEYLDLCSSKSCVNTGGVSKFILRRSNPHINKLVSDISKAYSSKKPRDIELLSISDWLASIRDSKLVITNSFHCVMMCLKLHTPFAVLLEHGTNSGMNDRFSTLLNAFNLSDRIISNSQDIANLSKPIDFSAVDDVMENYSSTLKKYLDANIV